jgi:diaminopimelate decarboxylase
MPTFTYENHQLSCGSVPLARLADEFGTPLYVYAAATIRGHYRRLASAFVPLRPLICYAVKANFNLSLLRLLQAEGAAFDIVSGGELFRAVRAGAAPEHIVFAGVGKTDTELAEGLAAGIGWFNVESASELARLNRLAAMRDQRARVALRLNPNVAPDTHHHIQTGGARNKFGLPLPEALNLARHIAAEYPAIELRGVHIHIGSQVPDPADTLAALEVALEFVSQVDGIDTLDLGGGFPVAYRDDDHFTSIEAFAAPIVARLLPLADRLRIHLEPGRYLVAEAGALLTTVQAVKDVAGRRTLVVDAGMQTLLRPALYDAYHRVASLVEPAPSGMTTTDVVGPICESADVLARARQLPALQPGERLALLDAGAYGFSMASQYNSQPRPAEVLVDGDHARLVRRRETYADLVAGEETEHD